MYVFFESDLLRLPLTPPQIGLVGSYSTRVGFGSFETDEHHKELLTKNQVSLRSICFSKLIYICNYVANLKHLVEAFIV